MGLKLLFLILGVLFTPTAKLQNQIRLPDIEDGDSITQDKRALQFGKTYTIRLGNITLEASTYYYYQAPPYLVVGDTKYGIYGSI